MELKRIAVRALIGIAVCVALCLFFSGTIRNITTPKVKIAKAATGKLVQNVELSASVFYPETEEVSAPVPAGQSFTVKRVNVRAGYPVKAGDIVIEAEITGYASAFAQAQSEYNAAMDSLMEVERKNAGITLRRSEQIYESAYMQLRAAKQTCSRAELDMRILLRAAGKDYSETGYPDGSDEALIQAIDAYRAAQAAQDRAQSEFDEAARRGIDDATWTYIAERQAAKEKLTACEEKLVELEERNAEAKAIRAPHDGYISEIKLQNGDTYDGSAPLYKITAEGSVPVLRADLAKVDQKITEGLKASMDTFGASVETEVKAIGFNDTGTECADIAINDEMLRACGSLYSMAQNAVKINIQIKGKESTCLVPSSAVRGSKNDRYVYIINETASAFGRKEMSLSKLSVKVLAEANGTASLQDDISYYNIAYMEDRPLSENCSVMAYTGE